MARTIPSCSTSLSLRSAREAHFRRQTCFSVLSRCYKTLTSSSVASSCLPLLSLLATPSSTLHSSPTCSTLTLALSPSPRRRSRRSRTSTLRVSAKHVVSFFDDLRDGTILLQAYDKVIPGSVNMRHMNKAPANAAPAQATDPDEEYLVIKSGLSRFKAVENTNYAVEIGKQNSFSLVGIQGADITDGQRTLTLGMVWQLMRRDIVNTLSGLAQRMGKREISDADMVNWANSMSAKGGKASQIRSFKDKSLANGTFFLDVLHGMQSSYVDYDLVAPGRTDEEMYANAKLAISIARKMGATIWLVPEDITNMRSRLIVTFVGSLMNTAEKMGA
jgi:plastin-1